MPISEQELLLPAFEKIEKEIFSNSTINSMHSVALSRKEKYKKFNELTINLPESLRLRIEIEIFDIGPIKILFDDQGINEILIQDHETIWFESGTKLIKYKDNFLSKNSYSRFIQKICSDTKTNFNFNSPFINGNWRGFRLHITSPPISNGVSICLRRLNNEAFTFNYLTKQNWCDDKAQQILKHQIQQKKNILIIGTTGSGKTSVLNTLLTQVESDRCIIIEDTDEILRPNSGSIKMLTHRTDQKINQTELVKQSLRMRPDRLILGEVRGKEAKDLMLALSTGHTGSFSTLHADNPQQALYRLEMLVQMGAPEWDINTIRRLIYLSLDSIILVRKRDDKRFLQSMVKIDSLEVTGFTLHSLYNRSE